MNISTIFAHTITEVVYTIKEKRVEKGLKQEELAEKIGKTAGYVSKLENRKYTNVTIKIILKLSQELGLDKVELFLFFCDAEELKMKYDDLDCLKE